MSTNNIFYYLIFLISITFSISIVPKEIKYFLFGLLMIHVIYSFLKSHLYLNFNQVLLLIVICLYPIFITLFNDIFRQFNEPFGYLTLVQSLIIFLASTNRKINDYILLKIIIYALLFGALISLIINFLVISGYLNIESLRFLENTQGVTLDFFSGEQRPLYQSLMSRFYLSSTILFIIPAVYFLESNNLILFLLCLFSIILSTSRTALLLCLFAFFFFLIRRVKYKGTLIKISFLLPLSLFLITAIFPRVFELLNIWEIEDSGLSGFGIRQIYIQNYLNNIDFGTFIFGGGLNTPIYNSYRDIFDKTEISQLNYLYQNGIIISLLALFTFIKIIQTNLKCQDTIELKFRKKITIALSLFFIASFSNPVLLHPLFIIMLSIISKDKLSLSNEYKNQS